MCLLVDNLICRPVDFEPIRVEENSILAHTNKLPADPDAFHPKLQVAKMGALLENQVKR